MANNEYEEHFTLGACYYFYIIIISINVVTCILLVVDDFVNDYQLEFYSSNVTKV